MYFSVRRPSGRHTPVVVEVPHAGLLVDPQSMASLVAPVRSIGLDADLYVDDLYEHAPNLGATVVVSHLSRYVCDLNRAEGDVDVTVATGGQALSAPHGLIWRDTTEGQRALAAKLPRGELERRLNHFYRPYHAQVRALLDEKLAAFGYVLLLAAHSMPARGRSGHKDPGRERAQVVPGSRGFTTAAPAVIDTPARLARARGWTVAHDDPYQGGFTTTFYGRPGQGQHAIQVELARTLYMDEQALTKSAGFQATQDYCSELVQELARLKPALLAARSG